MRDVLSDHKLASRVAFMVQPIEGSSKECEISKKAGTGAMKNDSLVRVIGEVSETRDRLAFQRPPQDAPLQESPPQGALAMWESNFFL